MGTLARAAPGAPLQFHYWQATEELRLFGPVDPARPSKPTDTRDWPCESTVRFVGIDARSVELAHGRWFFDEPACAASPPAAGLEGCVAERAAVR